ncbi:MAG: FAD/NAD(P)-binding protein [Alphaproteobacteria bacterium]|nr:FAD/NAD(P)-binding protein [Alphaproteobacteria bacterium]
MSPAITIIGGGFSGALLAMRLAHAAPDRTIHLIERQRRAGVGLAYGACETHHLLNVPTSRMELGLSPSFADWLATRTDFTVQDGGALADAFAPRALFGRYVEERLAEAKTVRRLRGDAVRVSRTERKVFLADGRAIDADIVVLATGNRPPAPLRDAHDGRQAVPDPWSRDAFDDLDVDAPVLFIGAGLTMVDIALSLAARGHSGEMIALSRHGLLPTRHESGGTWPAFLASPESQTARGAFALVRREITRAVAAGVPWRRVIDAARPEVARVWRSWPRSERARFLRHARAYWDIHRHRMAPQIADALDALRASGQLRVMAGRVVDSRDGEVRVRRRRGPDVETVRIARVFNCTGPASDFARIEEPLFADLRRNGLMRADALHLGIETEESAFVDARGAPSHWLFALGPLTRPAFWEVTAVPEIRAQVDALAHRLLHDAPRPATDLADAFGDLGAGI